LSRKHRLPEAERMPVTLRCPRCKAKIVTPLEILAELTEIDCTCGHRFILDRSMVAGIRRHIYLTMDRTHR